MTDYNTAFNLMLKGRDAVDTLAVLNKYDPKAEVSPGYEVPNDFTEALNKENLFRRLGTVVNIDYTDSTIETVISSAEPQLVGENEAYPVVSDNFENISFGSYKIASVSKISDTFIKDKKFDVGNYLKKEYAARYGRAEENIMLNGSGQDGEPLGLLASASVGVETATLSFDSVIELYFSLKAEYRSKGIWLVSDSTACILRKLKDENGNYLWNHNNDTILGRPVVVSPYMNSTDIPVAFGDLSYFWMLIRQPLRVRVLKELYKTEGKTGFASQERFDCCLVRNEAVKVLCISEEDDF